MKTKFELIQRGECQEPCITPKKAQMLAVTEGIVFPKKLKSKARNVNKDVWNRQLTIDFNNFGIRIHYMVTRTSRKFGCHSESERWLLLDRKP